MDSPEEGGPPALRPQEWPRPAAHHLLSKRSWLAWEGPVKGVGVGGAIRTTNAKMLEPTRKQPDSGFPCRCDALDFHPIMPPNSSPFLSLQNKLGPAFSLNFWTIHWCTGWALTSTRDRFFRAFVRREVWARPSLVWECNMAPEPGCSVFSKIPHPVTERGGIHSQQDVINQTRSYMQRYSSKHYL